MLVRPPTKSPSTAVAASFGQIYPELERLRSTGLVELDEEDKGTGSRRAH